MVAIACLGGIAVVFIVRQIRAYTHRRAISF